MAADYLSLEEVLAEAQTRGLDISERTFRYYGVLGLLPAAVKRKDGQTDARLAYYPAAVVERLQQIRQLQTEGYSLKQVKGRLEEAAPAGHPLWEAIATGRFSLAVRQWLQGCSSASERRAASMAWLRQLGQWSGSPLPDEEPMVERCLQELDQLGSHLSVGRDSLPALWSATPETLARLAALRRQAEQVNPGDSALAGRVRRRLLEYLESLENALKEEQIESISALAVELRRLQSWLKYSDGLKEA